MIRRNPRPLRIVVPRRRRAGRGDYEVTYHRGAAATTEEREAREEGERDWEKGGGVLFIEVEDAEARGERGEEVGGVLERFGFVV